MIWRRVSAINFGRIRFKNRYPSFSIDSTRMMAQSSQGIVLRAPQMPEPKNTMLMLCDIQDRFGTFIPNMYDN